MEEGGEKKGASRLAEKSIEREFAKYTDRVEVNVLSDNKCVVKVPSEDIARIIGKEGKTISMIEGNLGISIDVQELGRDDAKTKKEGREINYEINQKRKAIVFVLDISMQDKDVDIYIGDTFLLTVKTSSMGLINIKKGNKIGQILLNAINSGEKVRLVV